MTCKATDSDAHATDENPHQGQRLLLAPVSRGRLLTDAPGPYDMLQALLDAVYGHFSMLHYGHQIHEDVDLANVWYLPSPIVRTHPSNAKSLFESSLTERFLQKAGNLPMPDTGWREVLEKLDGKKTIMGVLADSRWARNWPITGPMPNQGIKRFMSMHLQEQLWDGYAVHTYLDDIEAFFWLIIYVTLHAFRARHENTPRSLALTDYERGLLEEMERDLVRATKSNHRGRLLPRMAYADRTGTFWTMYPHLTYMNQYLPLFEWGSFCTFLYTEATGLEFRRNWHPEDFSDKVKEIEGAYPDTYAFLILSGWRRVYQAECPAMRWDEVVASYRDWTPPRIP